MPSFEAVNKPLNLWLDLCFHKIQRREVGALDAFGVTIHAMRRFWSRDAVECPAEKSEAALDREYMVKWDHNDPLNPQNWSVSFKWWVTFQLGMLALAGSLGSSIITPADNIIAAYVGVSSEVAVLDVSLYM